jgi:hypothetical protein
VGTLLQADNSNKPKRLNQRAKNCITNDHPKNSKHATVWDGPVACAQFWPKPFHSFIQW